MTTNGIKRRIQKYYKKFKIKLNDISGIPNRLRRYYNRKTIKSRDFTIISNNCWAGKVYQYFDMPYLTPTVGLYFFTDDYLKFISNLKYYMGLKLQFISENDSKYKDILLKKGRSCPIGVLDDVEIVFLHYKSEKEAYEKWERRKKRINWNNLYFKISRQNLCTEDHLRMFANLPYQNKIILNSRKKPVYPCEYYWNGPVNSQGIIGDTEPFPGNIKLRKILR